MGVRGLPPIVVLMQTAIVANGQIDQPQLILPLVLRHKRVVAVDGGLAHCHNMGIKPHLIVGDFDSCPPSLLDQYPDVPKTTLKRNKDETDLEAAIQHEKDSVVVYGAWGYRIDHSLTNALLLCRFIGKMQIETEVELVFAIEGKTNLHCSIGQTLSLIPLSGPATGIHTKGLKWELNGRKLDQNFIGISNVCLAEKVEISLEQGSLIVCLIK